MIRSQVVSFFLIVSSPLSSEEEERKTIQDENEHEDVAVVGATDVGTSTGTVDGIVKALALDSICSKKRHVMDVFMMILF